MRLKAVTPLYAFLALTLCAQSASGQDSAKPRGVPTEAQVIEEQAPEENAGGLGLAFVTFLDGDSLFRSADDWEALSPNLPLRIGDRIWVQADAKVEIRFPLGATAWVNYESELDIAALENGGRADVIQLALVSGEASFDVKDFDRAGSFLQVELADATIRAFRAARFRVNTLPDGTAQISVSSGPVSVETADGFTTVRGGQMAELRPDRRVRLDFLPESDDWDAWVRSRAAIYDRPAASARHLPADLSPYAHEFDTAGLWVSEPAFGRVWVPTVEPGWSPYSNGHWVWLADDYVWLPYDPWYAPFHFGRWSWSPASGWFWIVPRGRAYWSPGYVSWSVTSEEVSWVPLGYNEVYHGFGNYGPASVNVLKKAPADTTEIYVNSRVSNGVVTVKKDNFLHGRVKQARIASSRNPFAGGDAGGSQIIRRPPRLEIQPIRETRQPRSGVELKRFSPPPARIDLRSRTIRERVVAPPRGETDFRNDRSSPASRMRVAPLPVERPRVGEPSSNPEPPAVQGRGAQRPAGQHPFKRMPEPREGAEAAPAPIFAPEDQFEGGRERRPSGEPRGTGSYRGSGDPK